MRLSRRQLLTRSAVASALSVTPKWVLASARLPLAIPPLLEAGRGRPIRLDFRPSQTQLFNGKTTEVWGANGYHLGPTVRVKSGDFLKLNCLNNLPEALSLNIQGLLAPSEMIGSAQRQIEPGSSWSPILTINQPACTAWYHANTPLQSAAQVYRGVAGLWLIEEPKKRQASLPSQYGVNDIPLILQDVRLNNQAQLQSTHESQAFLGNTLLTNGSPSPFMNVPRGWVRLRILNASLSRAYMLQLDNEQPLVLIAQGQGMLPKPQEQAQVFLPPGERVEVLVDLNEGQNVSLITGEKRGLLYPLEQFFQANDELNDNVVLELRPQGLPSALATKPQLSAAEPLALAEPVQNRQFSLRPLDKLINQQRFDPQRLDFRVKKGSVERWQLSSNEAVGFTLQGAKFVVESRNGEQIPEAQRIWLDTVWIEKDQTLSLLVLFEHAASAEVPFTFGASDLILRDRGCLGQFSVE